MKFIENVFYKTGAGVKVTLENIVYYPFHLHKDAIEILYVIDGEVDISDSTLDYHLKFGDVYFFNTEDPHKIHSKNDNIVLMIHLDTTYYSKFFPAIFETYFICDSFNSKEQYAHDVSDLHFFGAALFQEYMSQTCSDIKLIELTKRLLDIMNSEYRHYTFHMKRSGSFEIIKQSKEVLSSQTNKHIYEIVDYIFQNYTEKLTLRDIAEQEYLNSSHLSKTLKKVTGLTFSQLLSLARCEAATRLLCDTEKSIDVIALESGFTTRKELANNFKKWYQKTPSSFRNDMRKDKKNGSGKTCRTFDYPFAKLVLNSYLDGY